MGLIILVLAGIGLCTVLGTPEAQSVLTLLVACAGWLFALYSIYKVTLGFAEWMGDIYRWLRGLFTESAPAAKR